MATLDLTTYAPTVVIPDAPEYFNVLTETDGYKKTSRNIEPTAVGRWLVVFHGIYTSTGTPSKGDLLSHFQGEKGVNGASFKLANPPSYLGLGTSLDVRYKSWKSEPIEAGIWHVEFGLEEVP
ncbi:MAG: hypothetical protein ABIH23_31760 [bacterium]